MTRFCSIRRPQKTQKDDPSLASYNSSFVHIFSFLQNKHYERINKVTLSAGQLHQIAVIHVLNSI
uniref:Uncharacterized protein n=1 Tax=Arion vulgaris TaxID=1028688 RepID=A0A0B7ATI5_9EUPU